MASAVTASVTKSDSDQQTPKKVPSSSSANINQQQSPRNTSTLSTSNGTYVSTGPVEVSKALQDGEKFVKWDEVIMLKHTHIKLLLTMDNDDQTIHCPYTINVNTYKDEKKKSISLLYLIL